MSRVRGWTYLCLSVGIWAPIGATCVVGVLELTEAVALGLVAVLLTVGVILWTIPTILYWGQRSNESLLETLGQVPEPRAQTPETQRIVLSAGMSATAAAVSIPPNEEARDLLSLERFLREARFPNEASERNARTWLGYLHVMYPFLVAKLPQSVLTWLEPLKREVGAVPLSKLRSEVQEYMAKHQLAFPEVPSKGEAPPAKGPSSLPNLSDGGLPRVTLQTTRELRDSTGQLIRAGTEGLFVWFPPTAPNGDELVSVRIGESTRTLPLDSVIAVAPPGHAEVWNRNREHILGLDRPPAIDLPKPAASPTPRSAHPGQEEVRTSTPKADPDTETETLAPTETLLFDDTLEIEATDHAEVHATLKKGARVVGFAQELSSLPFDFYIMDRRNYVQFCEDRQGSEIYAETDRVALDFKRTIPKDGIWYFVFDTYGKQADREVRFELRATKPG